MKEMFFNVLYISGTMVVGAFALSVTFVIFGGIVDTIKDIIKGKW